MEQVVLQPTPEIRQIADLLDEVIANLLVAMRAVPPSGEYESDSEASLLSRLVVRHVEGVIALARLDLVLLPAAHALARSAFECAVRALWLLEPDDPFEREARWLVHLHDEERYLEHCARRAQEFGEAGSRWLETRDTIQQFRLQVSERMPAGYTIPKKLPSFDEILGSLQESQKYIVYKLLSQGVHGTHAATGLYRRHLGTCKETGEFVAPADWELPLVICWFSLQRLGRKLLDRTGGDEEAFLPADLVSRLGRAGHRFRVDAE